MYIIIRRNAYFYHGGNNQYHWCSPCYSELKENTPIRLLDLTLHKSELTKEKHSIYDPEPWVECDSCKLWVHQICALFNGRRNFSVDETIFFCPTCVIEKRRKAGEAPITSSVNVKMQASDLPQSTLGQFLERKIAQRLQRAYEDNAEKLSIPIEQVEKCNNLTLRVVSSYDKDQNVRDGVQARYKNKNYPLSFPSKVKCIVLFQNIDGQDVILFGMYVYEFGHKCPDPNQRRVYVSYLDSVHYFRPRQYRTLVYHEILVSYLDYVKRRGFHTVHIWACPPAKGDDYILYVHPPDQKTPKDDKLRKWYVDMLNICVERKIIVEVSNIYDEYLADPSFDATVLPYFEGDYWVNEAEVIIKDLKDGKHIASDVNEGDKSKRKNKVSRPTRQTTGPLINKSDRDPVMTKLASIIEPMKEAFFVARLHPKEYADKCAANRKKEIEEESLAKTPDGTLITNNQSFANVSSEGM
jgi:E1A/CREB-binding protein